MKDNANDTTRPSPNPFMVPGPARFASNESTSNTQNPPTSTTESRRQATHNQFRWVVPSEEGNLDNESNLETRVSSPALPGHDHGDAPQQSTQINDNDALDRLVQPRRTIPTQYPKTEGPTQSTGLTNPNPETEGAKEVTGNRIVSARRTIPTSGYRDDDDDRTSITGHSEDEQPNETPWPGVTGDDETPFIPSMGVRSVDETGDRDDDHRVYAVDSTRLREGVQIGTVKRELIDYRPRSKRRTPRQQSRPPFSPQIPKILDFLTRWRIGTTVQLARVAGWTDSNENRILKKLRSYDEVGFLRETNLYAGPKIWTATEHGAERGFHPWLGGVKASEINPMSQSHSFGLSSIASWLLCPWDTTPNILGLSTVEWSQVRGEIRDGTAYVLSEKEYRSAYASIRTTGRGLLPPEYRHGFIGGPGGQSPVTGAWREWARAYKTGDATLADSPELLACDPEFMGANLWMWIIWGNSVWNPKVLETRAAGDGIDVDDLSWAGRDGVARLLTMFRQYGFVDIEERLDIATNKPRLNKELGDKFSLWDHLPDLIIARRRTDDEHADSQSIALELELSAKTPEAYARTMASYGSTLGQTLYRKVIWLVPSKTIADKIRAGASQVGMILGEDYEIVPFVTSNEASVIKRSFYSGADILPGCWTKRGTIEPTMAGGRSIPLE